MAKTKRNFSIDMALWKKFRLLCLEKNTTASAVIVSFIKKQVEKHEAKKKKT